MAGARGLIGPPFGEHLAGRRATRWSASSGRAPARREGSVLGPRRRAARPRGPRGPAPSTPWSTSAGCRHRRPAVDGRWRRSLILRAGCDRPACWPRRSPPRPAPRRWSTPRPSGYYGDRGDEELTETSGPGTGSWPTLCRGWEAATEPARRPALRVVCPQRRRPRSGRRGAAAASSPSSGWASAAVSARRPPVHELDHPPTRCSPSSARSTTRPGRSGQPRAPEPVRNAEFTCGPRSGAARPGRARRSRAGPPAGPRSGAGRRGAARQPAGGATGPDEPRPCVRPPRDLGGAAGDPGASGLSRAVRQRLRARHAAGWCSSPSARRPPVRRGRRRGAPGTRPARTGRRSSS